MNLPPVRPASPVSDAPGPTDPAPGVATAVPPSAPPSDPGLEKTLAAFSDLAYRDAFWPSRAYEDACDRIAVRSLLPPSGGRLIDVGAGYGRLADEYAGYREVVLLDASEPHLQAARERFAGDPRVSVVAGDAFQLPFPDASFDAAVCIRVLHHFEDPGQAIRELGRIVRPGGVLILESANKRNLKSVIAYWLRRQDWSPFARGSRRYAGVRLLPRGSRADRGTRRAVLARAGAPVALWSAPVSYVHSPRDLRIGLRRAGFGTPRTRSVGLLRLPVLTAGAPAGLLVALERVLQPVLAPVTAGPSIILGAVRLPAAPPPSGGPATAHDPRA